MNQQSLLLLVDLLGCHQKTSDLDWWRGILEHWRRQWWTVRFRRREDCNLLQAGTARNCCQSGSQCGPFGRGVYTGGSAQGRGDLPGYEAGGDGRFPCVESGRPCWGTSLHTRNISTLPSPGPGNHAETVISMWHEILLETPSPILCRLIGQKRTKKVSDKNRIVVEFFFNFEKMEEIRKINEEKHEKGLATTWWLIWKETS